MRRRESRHRCLPRLGHRCRRPPAQASAEAMSAARTRPMRHRRACSRSPEAREARRGQQGCARGWHACFSPMVGAGGVAVVARRARGSFGGASVQGGRADGGRRGRGHGRRRVRVEVGWVATRVAKRRAGERRAGKSTERALARDGKRGLRQCSEEARSRRGAPTRRIDRALHFYQRRPEC